MPTVLTPSDIGSAIKAAREVRGLTQAQLGGIAKVHQPKISEIERGKDTAHVGLVLRILVALDLVIEVVDRRALAAKAVVATVAPQVIFDEPLPDDSIDIDSIVGSRRR